MEEKKPRISGLLIALIVVAILLLLLGSMQYSLKHNLPATQRLNAWLGRSQAEPAKIAATPAPTVTAAETSAPEIDLYETAGSITSYTDYLTQVLVPAYGQASKTAIDAAQSASYVFAEGADTTGATGLVSAQVIDLDNDGVSELAVLLIREDNGSYPLELHIYGMPDGEIKERTPAAVVITNMELPHSQTDSVEIVSQNAAYYLLYHQYVEENAAFCDRYVAFTITAGSVEKVLDGVYAYYGGAVLIAGLVPPWLSGDALSGAPALTDAMSGLSGTGLYADAIQGAAYSDGTASYEAYKALYDDSITALNVMLGPLAGTNRMTLLEPLSRDWTDLVGLLSGTDAAQDESSEDEAFSTEDLPEYSEDEGYAPPDDYVELDTPE